MQTLPYKRIYPKFVLREVSQYLTLHISWLPINQLQNFLCANSCITTPGNVNIEISQPDTINLIINFLNAL